MKKRVLIIIGVIVILVGAGCKKEDSTNPSIDENLQGFWFKLTAEDRIAVDVDGYFWGVQIEMNGNVTVARLDYIIGSLNTEATGPAFTLTKADAGSFSGSSDGENFTGTYQLGTVSNAGYDYHSVNLISSQIIDYLPGGSGGDWSVMGKYIKIYNLDYTDASIGESEVTSPPVAPTNLTFNRTSNGGPVTLEWYDNSSTETGFEIERRLHENGDYVKIKTTTVDEYSYTDNSVAADEVYQYRVRAFNGAGNSAYTNVVDVKGVPKAPWDLAVNYNNSTYNADFSWKARYSDDIIYFQFAFYEEGSWVDLGFTTDANPTNVLNNQWIESESMSYSGGDPWPAGTYTFKVKAINSEGESAYSESVDLVISAKKSTPDFFDYSKLNANK